jgi:hypothetical protein
MRAPIILEPNRNACQPRGITATASGIASESRAVAAQADFSAIRDARGRRTHRLAGRGVASEPDLATVNDIRGNLLVHLALLLFELDRLDNQT